MQLDVAFNIGVKLSTAFEDRGSSLVLDVVRVLDLGLALPVLEEGVVNDAGRGVDVIIDDVDHRVLLILGLLPAIEGLHAVADGSGDDLHAVADPP